MAASSTTDDNTDTESNAPSEYSVGGKSNYSFTSNGSRNGFISAIRGQETFEPQGRFTLYKVEVNNGERTWIVYRRYSDFVLLNKKLKRKFPGFQLNLPPKRIFRNNFDRLFIQKRQRGLEDFMKHLFSLQDVMEAEPVRKFFRLDNPPGPNEDLTASRDYCHSLEVSLKSLKKEIHDQDYELGHLRSELARMQFNAGDPNAYKSQIDASFTEKVLQQKLIAAEEIAFRAGQEVERMRVDANAEKALEQSTRQTEKHRRELHVRELMREFHHKQQQEDEAVKSMAAAFAGCGKVSVDIGGRSIDFNTIEGVAEREEDLNRAITEARKTLEDLHKEHLELNKKEIEDLKTDLVRLEYQLQTANTEAQTLRDMLAQVHASRNEEIISKDKVIFECQNQLVEARHYAESTEQKYFYSLILGVKLNMALWGKATDTINQLRPSSLFSRVRDQGISIEHWPSWVSRELATLADLSRE